MRYAALLRGVNVGAHAQLAMPALVAMFERAGCEDVTAYLRSGNVVFTASAAVAKRVPAAVTAAVAKARGFAPPVLLRDAKALASVVARNPFPDAAADGTKLHVAFLAGAPKRGAIASLEALRASGEELVLSGKELYLHMPNGVGRSKLAAAVTEARLGTVPTARNWNTVLRLVELTGG